MIMHSQQSRPSFIISSLIFLLVFILSSCGETSSTSQDGNQQPIAKITASLVYTAGKTVTLDGSNSSDPDGDALSFRWEQIEGPVVTLSGVSTATLSFVAPTVSQSTQFSFQLTVDDGDLSSTASVSFQLSPSGTNPDQPNQQPYAMIIAPEAATSGQTVTLNGSGSSDPDDDNLTYKWMQTQGPSITLSNSTSSTLTFVAPTVSQSTQFTFQLTVEDGELSSTASVNIQVTPRTTTNQQPSAKITATQTATSGQTVTLNGSDSSDPDGGTLSFQWKQTEGPDIALSNSSSSSLTFVAPAVTQTTKFTFQLTVHDGELSNSASVSMQISPMGGNTSPSIVSRSPLPDQSGVSITTEISARFDKALLESSVDSQSLLLSQNGISVPGAVSYDSSNYTLTYKPTSDLSAGVTYTVTLAGTIKDLSGNAFAGASWSFSTAAGTVVTDGTCAMAEENNSLTLSCPSGEVITGVEFASYGNPGGECGSFTAGSCNASNSVTVVSDECKDKNSCTLYAGSDSFGNPCEGTAKKLAVEIACGMATDTDPNTDADLFDLQQSFVDLRFGMFLHFGIRTFTGGGWAKANQDISKFNPTAMNAGQWADAAVSANMKFGVLTTKHHDGFALWNSAYSDYDIANTPYKSGKGDVVSEYVEAFRSRGLGPGLYYSIWDTTQGISGDVTEAEMRIIKGQLEELLTNYGDIPILIFDGWSWSMGHNKVRYDEIRAHVKGLQPNCLMIDLTHLQDLWEVDAVFFEEPKGVWAPESNTLPASQGTTIGDGNGWFWGKSTPTSKLISTQDIVEKHLEYLEPLWVTFILNCPPNTKGLLDDNIVKRLAEVGAAWAPDLTRPPLPDQAPFIKYPITPVSAKATSGNAHSAIDGVNDTNHFTIWKTDNSLPQSITLDLGNEIPNVSMLSYVPRYNNPNNPSTDGSITSYRVLTSTDGTSFNEVASGSWDSAPYMKVVTFNPTPARYVRLEAVDAVNNHAAATEISVGRESW